MKGNASDFARKTWQFLDGKKTFLVLGLISLKHYFPGLPIWPFVDSAFSAIGWKDVAPAVDPDTFFTFISLGLALGHRLHKAWGESMPVEWKTIGTVPEIKDLKSPTLVEAPVPPVAPPPTPRISDVRAKKELKIGTFVLLSDGKSAVITKVKERSANGFTYEVEERD